MTMAARYLVRFDDICPGMNWSVWRDIEAILVEQQVKPMLAVVPDNADSNLDVAPKVEDFWPRVREWQARGWGIGLHGYQHRYVTREAGLIGINDRSEFAGLPAAEQQDKLERGLAIFRAQSVRADVWIAPAHSFDDATLEALHRLGVPAVSDGFFLTPHRDRRGLVWVPQQIWGFRYRPFGVWTVCYHHNAWTPADVRRFAADLRRRRQAARALVARRRGLGGAALDPARQALGEGPPGERPRMKALAAACCALALASAVAAPPFEPLIADHAVRLPAPIPVPAWNVPMRDPVFGTAITRVTDPGQAKDAFRIRHYYSKANPFNADETRAIFFASDGRRYLYDTKTWTPVRELKVRSREPEIQWHPANPNLFYYLDAPEGTRKARAMFLYDIRDDSSRLLHDFREYETVAGRMEGNMDRAGRYYAMVGTRADGSLEAFVYDVAEDKAGLRLFVIEKMVGDWISVSPSGRYVVMMGDRSYVYDIRMRHVRDLPPKSFGHADICLLADGTEALVYDGADHQLNNDRNINIANLDTGKITIGVRIGWKSTPHVSCRNFDTPGWALVSTQGPDPKYPNHDFEIFWLKLDGSKEVRRVAHHRSLRAVEGRNGGYFAEQHAVTNKRGDKVIFASNWGGKEIAAYLVELAPPGAPPAKAR